MMLKILQARLQQYMNGELPDVQAGFRKGRGTRDQIATSAGSSKKQESSRKTSTSALLTLPKSLTVWTTANSGKFLKRWEYQITLPASWEACMQVKKQQLELDMEQQTGSNLGKEYVKTVYCHPAYLTHMPSTLCVEYITHHGKCWVGWITSWNQDCQEKYQQLQICRWYHSNSRKRKVTKEPLDEDEGGQWQIDLKLNIQKTKIYSHHFMANRWGKSVSSNRFYFLGLQNHCRRWLQPWY